MVDAGWWMLHGLLSGGLLGCVLLATMAARRVGQGTPYGGFLVVLSLGFWLLLVAEGLFVGRTLSGGWRGPGAVNDVPGLLGWALLDTAFFLFALRFPGRGVVGSAGTTARTVAWAAAPAVALLLLFPILSPPGADPAAGVRLAYLLLDGLGLGLAVAMVEGLRRLRHSALGRLYALLVVALLCKTAGDVAWTWLAARGETSLLATASYAAAGALGFAAFALHARLLRREGFAESGLDDPRLPTEQRTLRDLARSLRGLAGGYAAEVALQAAAASLRAEGIPSTLRGDLLEADAPALAWRGAVTAAAAAALATFGEAAQERVRAVEQAYGVALGGCA